MLFGIDFDTYVTIGKALFAIVSAIATIAPSFS